MKILIEVSGGCVVDVLIDKHDPDFYRVFLFDHDDQESGSSDDETYPTPLREYPARMVEEMQVRLDEQKVKFLITKRVEGLIV